MEPSAGIVASLRKLTCPAYDSVWIGPFEQLVGAGYAFVAAIQHGIYRRNLDRYNLRVQAKIVPHIETLISAGAPSDPNGFDDWLSGFYFNSGIQRVVWAAERLLLTCAALKCRCGLRPAESEVSGPRPPWPQVLKGALLRLDHVRDDDHFPLEKVSAVRDQFIVQDALRGERGHERGDPLDRGKVLAMLRYDVNNRKHRVYERAVLRDHMPAGKGDNKTWSSSGADFQMDLARGAFDLVCDAYEELTCWNPSATL